MTHAQDVALARAMRARASGMRAKARAELVGISKRDKSAAAERARLLARALDYRAGSLVSAADTLERFGDELAPIGARYHLTVGGKPYCERLGCVAGQRLAKTTGIHTCEHATKADATKAARLLQPWFVVPVEVVPGACPAVAL